MSTDTTLYCNLTILQQSKYFNHLLVVKGHRQNMVTRLQSVITPPPNPPCAVHAGRYGQQAGGMHPTGMQSCSNCFQHYTNNCFFVVLLQVGISSKTFCFVLPFTTQKKLNGEHNKRFREYIPITLQIRTKYTYIYIR